MLLSYLKAKVDFKSQHKHNTLFLSLIPPLSLSNTHNSAGSLLSSTHDVL